MASTPEPTDDELRRIMAEEGVTAEEMPAMLEDLRKVAAAACEAEDPPPVKTYRLQIEAKPGEDAKAIAQASVRPSIQAATAIMQWSAHGPFKDLDYMEVVHELQRQVEAVSRNDLGRPESMLIAQAHTLDAMFNELMRVARLNMFKNPEAGERFMRLGFKAQSQCRASLETLAELKNPTSATFVKQANIANGPQQVNNGALARAENQKSSNELLEKADEPWLESCPQSPSGRAHSPVAAVAALNGAEIPDGQGPRKP